MNTRMVFGYLAICAALSANGVRGISGFIFYAFGLALCLLIGPIEQRLAERRVFIAELRQFESDATQARLVAVRQLNVGGKH